MPTTEILINSADNSVRSLNAAATPNSSGHTTVKGASTGTLGSAGATTVTFGYDRVDKGGNTTYIAGRYFGFFDTSGISASDNVTSAKITINRSSTQGNEFVAIILKSDAFGGDGGTALIADDYNNLDFSTAYSSAVTIADVIGTTEFTLNSTAITDIKNNNVFICAFIDHTHDFSNSDPGAGVNAAESGIFNTGDVTTTAKPKLTIETANLPANTKITSGLIKLTSGLVRIS